MWRGRRLASASDYATVALSPEQTRRSHARPIWNIEQFLARNWVHGGFSSYSIRFWQGTAWVIDFPEAVDARTNRNAAGLLYRDLENVCAFFETYGIRSDPDRITRTLWRRCRFAEL